MRATILLCLIFLVPCIQGNTVQALEEETSLFRRLEDVRAEFQKRLDEVNSLKCVKSDYDCLNKQLELRGKIDQLARDPNHIKCDCFSGYGFEEGNTCFPIMLMVDQDNSAFLDEFLIDHGFPAGREWSQEATLAAFLIIQHGDGYSDLETSTARREKYLPDIKRAVLAKQLIPFGYAAMADRIQLYRTGAQTYGTQFNCDEGKAIFEGVPDTAQVDAARMEIGFQPFSETLSMANSRCEARSKHPAKDDNQKLGKKIGDAIAPFQARLDKLKAQECDIQDVACLNKQFEQRNEIYNQVRNPEIINGDCFDGLGFQTGDKCQTVMELIDPENRQFLNKILEVHGFPLGGEWEASTSLFAWVMIDHKDWQAASEEVDASRREKYLPDIKRAVESDVLWPLAYAITYDRVSLYRTGQQTFGTKLTCADGKPVFENLPAREVLDAKRAEIGLPPFSEQEKIGIERCASSKD